jgi:hypothetical protein
MPLSPVISIAQQCCVTVSVLKHSTTAANSSGKAEGLNSHSAVSSIFKVTNVADWITNRTQLGCVKRVENNGNQ